MSGCASCGGGRCRWADQGERHAQAAAPAVPAEPATTPEQDEAWQRGYSLLGGEASPAEPARTLDVLREILRRPAGYLDEKVVRERYEHARKTLAAAPVPAEPARWCDDSGCLHYDHPAVDEMFPTPLAETREAAAALLRELYEHNERRNGPWTMGMRGRVRDLLAALSALPAPTEGETPRPSAPAH